MANTASYPIVTPKVTDLIIGTQTFTAADPVTDNPTRNFTVASLISLVPGGGGGSGSVTSVAATTAGNALDVGGSPITSNGTLAFTWAGAATQYVNGLGNLITFPTLTSGTVTAVDTSSEVPALTLQTTDGTTTPSLELDVNGGTAGQFLRQDGNWATIPGGLQLGTTSTTALAGNTTIITSAQSIAITANTSKVGYTEALVSANTNVAANTAKTGITAAQATNITDSVKNNTDTYTGTADVQKVITLSQAEYTAIATPNVNTLYIII